MIVELGGGFSPSYCKRYGTGINMDVLDHELVDIKHDLRILPLPLKDNEVDEIYSKFFLEHVSWRILPKFIKDVHRILKPGGRAVFIVPDLRKQMEFVMRREQFTLEPVVQMIFGDQNYEDDKWQWNAHASSCSSELYEALFKQAGFSHFHSSPLPNWFTDIEITGIKRL